MDCLQSFLKRFGIACALVLLLGQTAFASITFKNKCVAATLSSNSVACSISGTAVSAGDLVVAVVGWETDGLTASVSDTASTFVGRTVADCGSQHCHMQAFYSLSSVATGTPTYTATITGATFPAIAVFVFTPSAAVSFDAESVGGGTNFGTAVDSGALTTTGADEMVVSGSFIQNSPTPSAWQIGGTSASTNEQTAFAGAYTVDNWYLAKTGTINGTETLSGSNWWVAVELSFKVTGGGGASCNGGLLLLGAGGC